MLLCPTASAPTEAGVLGALQSGTAEIPYSLTPGHALAAEEKE